MIQLYLSKYLFVTAKIFIILISFNRGMLMYFANFYLVLNIEKQNFLKLIPIQSELFRIELYCFPKDLISIEFQILHYIFR